MNSSSDSIHDRTVLGEARKPVDRRLVGFLILLALTIVAGLLIWQTFGGAQTAAPLTGERFLAANPEFLAVESYAAWQPATSTQALPAEEASLALNPELMVVARYAKLGDDHAFLAQNPELSAVRRYEQLRAAE